MNRKTPETKLNIPLCMACILFCLTLFSLHLTGGLYAKYTAKAEGGDSARVAKFVVTQKGIKTGELMTFTLGEPITVRVINHSEVAVENKIELVNKTGNIPATMPADTGTLQVDQEETYTLCPAMADPAEAAKYMGMVDYIQIKLISTQVD